MGVARERCIKPCQRKLRGLDVDTINVYINSYGGEVAEGWAIYNSLEKTQGKK